MKTALGLSLGLVAAALLGGCHPSRTTPSDGVAVVVEGHGDFPASLAGRWRADRDGWEIVLEPDGRISSAVIGLGRVRIVPGQTAHVPTRTGNEGVFTPGPWTVHYVPADNELTIKIAMDHVRLEMADATIEGKSTDTFSGVISPRDGVWQVQWTAFTQYTAHTPENPAVDLSTDPIYGETKALTFQRIPPEQPLR